MISNNIKVSYLFLIIILAFILITNTYFDYNQSLLFGGADGVSYYEISEKAPLSRTRKAVQHTRYTPQASQYRICAADHCKCHHTSHSHAHS